MTTFKSVRYGKSSGGSIVLTPSCLVYRDNAGKSIVAVPWSSVEKHQVSPASHPECMLRLLLRREEPSSKRPRLEEPSKNPQKSLCFTLERPSPDAPKRTADLAALRRGTSDGLRAVLGPSSASSRAVKKYDSLPPSLEATARGCLLSRDSSLAAQHAALVGTG
eukprot:CAMPEP_0113298010 /NCGR_PEP_ID=MMETSP0010_2-20120614/633_1 /TAXON_ID=216773 ORGANISM="Corethron hystrix, Strain 308" /NCGR_SAMPLE_ID=MMETSP0010_2 /ASSEMBLY_ACC=CAM_ASM_000155 /LENGTH=163 /DNA_ID=CAMNT_0000150993 /DNA_START=47 /DNA_END=535 /DNA_ORIENTATION=+ /assembly_acc=CAM_ASM_000155